MPNALPNRLFLLDGMALVYRAHFALIRSPITNSQGVNTSAAFGFLNTLLAITEKENPTHLAVSFDTSAPTSRHEKFPAYKAQREAMPQELAAAIPVVKKLCEALRIPLVIKDGFEADDLIGTFARLAEEEGTFQTFMVTPDKDFAQLVAPRTAIWKPGRKGSDHEILDLPAILKNWEIENPRQVIDILGLWGDSSDNIPGIPGIGEKIAKKLIAQYGSIENLLAHSSDLKGKQKENVENFGQQALLSKDLATILLDAPLDYSLADLAVTQPDEPVLRALLEDLEFRTLTRRLFPTVAGPSRSEANPAKAQDRDGPATPPIFDSLKTIPEVPHTYHLVKSPADLDTLLTELKNSPSWCFDTETTGLDRFESRLLGIAFSTAAHTGWYLPVSENLNELRQKLVPIFASPALKIGHNLKFDLAILRNHGFKVTGPFFDTMLAHQLVAPDQKHSMDYLAESLLGYSPIKYADLAETSPQPGTQAVEEDLFTLAEKKKPKKKPALDLSAIPLEKLADYAAEDADVTLQLATLLRKTVADLGMTRVMDEIESPLLPVLVEMEAEGIAINLHLLAEISTTLENRIASLATEITAAAGTEFNLNSPKQLGEILFDRLQLIEKPKKTKTGQYKTDEATLASLAPHHPIVENLLNHRQATKLKSTYVDALPEHLAPSTGRIHTHLHQLIAATGRMASSDPNLQNIPIRTAEGREIRKAFVPRDENFTLLAADYSQIELRVMAALSGDEAMIEAFRQGLDIHLATAARVYHIPLEEVESSHRRTAKMVNFGIIFGISPFGLSQRLGIPRAEAEEIITTYFKQYPGIKNFMETTIETARTKGYVETLTGRRRYFPELTSQNATIRNNAERAAINSPIQGTAADLIKLAMIDVQKLLVGKKTKLLLQVHDELLFDLHLEEKETLLPQIVHAMETALPLPNKVPVLIETGFGKTWLEAH